MTLRPDYRLNRGQIDALLALIAQAGPKAVDVDPNDLRAAKLKLELQLAWLD